MEHKTGLDYANKLNKEDPLTGYKQRFYIPMRETLDMDGKTKSNKPIIYMDGNSLGLASKDVEEEMKAEFERWKDLSTRRSGVDKKAAKLQAELVGAEPEEVILTGGGGKNRGLVKALSEQLGCDLLVPSEPLITGALGAALLGKDIFDKAIKTNSPLETKSRVFEAIEVL